MLPVLLLACSATPFPGDPQPSGVRDVPFVDTYNFGFVTGAQDRGSIGGLDRTADLRIYSAADLSNLLAAANVSNQISGGVLSGVVLFGPFPVSEVLLEVRDFEGRIVPDVFYNGLGGVPDFAAADGTADNGDFTVFNVPQGEVFIRATGGGQGVSRVGVFDGAISIKPIQVVPIVLSEIGVTGPITDAITGLNVWPVELSALGLQKDPRFSDDQGLLQLTKLVGFRVILPSNGVFLVHGTTPGYEPAYQLMDTNLSDLGDAVDLTRFVQMIPTAQVDDWFAQTGLTRQPGTGIVYGKVESAADTPQAKNRVGLFRFDGQPAGDVFIGRKTLFAVDDPAGENFFNFVALNVPPGPVFFRGGSFIETAGYAKPLAGADIIDVFPDTVTLKEVRVAAGNAGDGLIGPVLTSLRGVVTLSDLSTTVTDVVIDVGGYPAGPGTTDGAIRSHTVFSGEEFRIVEEDRSPVGDRFDTTDSQLLVNGNYLVRVSDLPGNNRYMDTYQTVNTFNQEPLSNGSLEVVRNLRVYTLAEVEAMSAMAGVAVDPGRGVLFGRILSSRDLAVAEGIQIKVLDEDGNEVGEVRYMDELGLPQRLDSSSSNGEFVVFNVPPGMVLIHVVSQNDTGSKLARAYPGGATVTGYLLVGDAPDEQVAVSGTARTFDGLRVAGAQVTFHGEPNRDQAADTGFLSLFTSNKPGSEGAYSTTLGIQGDYIVSVDGGSAFYKTYNHEFSVGLTPRADKDVYALSRPHVTQVLQDLQAGGRTIVQDPAKGIVFGEIELLSWLNDPSSRAVVRDGVVGPTAVSPAWLNADRYRDLIVADGDSDEVSVYFGTAQGGLEYSGSYPVGLSPTDLLGMDVDGDGNGDILVLNQGATAGEVTVLLGNVRGGFRADPSRRLLTGNAPIQMALGDMDGDGRVDDLVVLNGGGAPSISVFYLNPERQFVEAPYSPQPLFGLDPAGMAVADLDRDATGDARLNVQNPMSDVTVAMKGSDSAVIYKNFGNALAPEIALPLASGSRPVDVIRYDINRDGNPTVDRDLELIVLTEGLNNVQFIEFVGNSARAIAPPVDLDPGCVPRRMQLIDVNQDTKPDLVVMCSGNGTVTVYLGEGNGFFSPWQCAAPGCRRPPLVSGTGPFDFSFGDFDTQPGSDLVVANKFSNTVTMFYAVRKPMEGVPVTVTDLEGVAAPDVVYLDDAGRPIPDTRTGPSGRFMAFNVSPGNAWISAVDGDNGNRRVVVFPDAASYTRVSVVAGSPASVNLKGLVNDAVNTPQQDIEVTFAGMGIQTVTGVDIISQGSYEVAVPSNQNNSMIRLRQP